MKILVVSDSHGNASGIMAALDREKPDVLIHLGDGLKDLKEIKFDGQIFAASGNCDINKKVPKKGKLRFGNITILYTHGNSFNVSKNLNALAQYAITEGATIALYGHTHKADYSEIKGVKLVNPGALKGITPTYCVLDLENKNFKITHEILY